MNSNDVISVDGQCLNTCPDEESTFSGDNLHCQACSNGCKTCSGSYSNQCLSCMTSYYTHLVNQCVATCPTGFYLNGNACSPCDTSCYECSGGNFDNCTECAGSYKKYLGNQCKDPCPENYDTYLNSSICD
jgi:proprotein convertase subtilisin/kexin type 5